MQIASTVTCVLRRYNEITVTTSENIEQAIITMTNRLELTIFGGFLDIFGYFWAVSGVLLFFTRFASVSWPGSPGSLK